MRPQSVEGNLYAYHLKALLNDKLIEKTDTHYQLTPKGLQLVSTLSLNTGKMRRQPQILNAIICRNDKNEYLWSRWRREPNMNMVSFPHGMMHFGEALSQAAARELREKAALQGELTYRGDVYVRGLLGGVLDRHMLVHLFEANNVQDDRGVEPSQHVESFWSPLAALEPADFVPGFYEIAQLVEHAGEDLIFADIMVDVAG
jgi:8-oxo-dGTP pyrophosphatase MutT (NUDIX family)